jgi:hypothetical protein
MWLKKVHFLVDYVLILYDKLYFCGTYFQAGEVCMIKSKALISVLELKRLLIDLKEKRPDICIRYRLIGELWVTSFRRVVSVADSGASFNDEVHNKLFFLRDISNIMQFELDNRFQDYQPFFHYNVTADREY